MSIIETTNTVNQLAHAWEEFKVINDRRLREIENKGHSNILDNEQLTRINKEIDECQDRLNDIEQSHNRPTLDTSTNLSEKQSIFNDYIRCGRDTTLIEQKASHAMEGGFTLTGIIYEQVMKSLKNNSTMRQVAAVEAISGDYMTFFKSEEDVPASWGDTVNDTALPNVVPQNIFTHTLHACPKITQRLLDDAAVDINRWVIENISDAFSNAENKAFFNGGDNSPSGILNGNIEAIASAKSDKLSDEDLILLYYELGERYAKNASFIMHRSTVQYIRSIKSEQTGQYIWQPGLSDNPDTLMGVPIYQSAEMPEISHGNTIIAFGDFKKGYKIIDRTGINILRDHFSYKPNVAFYATKRVGGNIFDRKAIVMLKMLKK